MQAEAYFLCNFLMELTALRLGARLSGLLPLPRKRLFVSAALGGLFALFAAAYPSPLLLVCFPLSMRLYAGKLSPGSLARAALMHLCALCLTGGMAHFLQSLRLPPVLAYLLPVSAAALITLLLGFPLEAVSKVRQVELLFHGRRLCLPALVDTGNLLQDSVTGLPVMVIPLKAACLLDPSLPDWYRFQRLPEGLRLMRVRTASGSSLMPLLRPEKCTVCMGEKRLPAGMLAAVAGPEYTGRMALIPSGAVGGQHPISI